MNHKFEKMKNFSKLTNSGFTFIFLLILVCTKLSFAPAKPMPESPILSFQEKNVETRKLSIHFIEIEAVDVEISFKSFK